jgi:predicted O-linked N-acetylglucosamine transferase (SPINDLY family)
MLFDAWMRALARVPGSVLWLAHAHPQVQARLRTEAQRRGIDGRRIMFARHRPLAGYLAGLRHADLFLDTFGYTAGSTAVCALWAGLPVLTRLGDSNAGRMGASIAAAAGQTPLICADAAAYERRAVQLASERTELRQLRAVLVEQRRALPLFDVPGFASALEDAFDRLRAAPLAQS